MLPDPLGEEEAPHAPFLITERVDDLQACGHRRIVSSIHVVDFDRYRRVHGRRRIRGQQAD